MFNSTFYHSTLANITIAFGSLFNDINVMRFDSSGNEESRIKVPIHYGPKEKYLARLAQDPDLRKQTAITLPRITFQRTGIEYDSSRKLNNVHKNRVRHDNLFSKTQFIPTPYNINYTLSVMTKNARDGDQIIEQILPYFNPSFDVSIKTVNELDYSDDMPVILNSISEEDTYEGDFIERRAIIWTLEFTIKANLYGPVSQTGIIRKVQVDIGVTSESPIDDDVVDSTPRVVRITVQPDPIDANPSDSYDYFETLEIFNDGKKFDPVSGDDVDIE